MRKFLLSCLVLIMSAGIASGAAKGPMGETLGRGVIAMKTSSGVFVSWRSLTNDPKDLTFDVYRDGAKVNAAPITKGTFYKDASGTTSSMYKIVASDGTESTTVGVESDVYKRVKLDRPAKDSRTGATYTPNDCSVGDVDGDGEYEIFVKWDPSNSQDNSISGKTGDVLIDCYKLDGTKLWRVNLGQNIRAGAHYTQFMVYDFDQDGKAEMICKTAPGTKDGLGKNVIMGSDSPTASYINSSGQIIDGPEYLTVFNGLTGAEINTIAYNPPRTVHTFDKTSNGWGDNYGGRSERYLAGVAYVDGMDELPCAIMCRGYYTHAYVWAVKFDGTKLTERWLYKSNKAGANEAYGEGAHSLTIGDCDGDGKDEIVYGGAAIDHDGKILYATRTGHGDALHLGAFNPDREGLQVFMVHEEKSASYKYDSEFRDAKTGEILWGTLQSGNDIGRGLVGNISSKFRGYEVWPGAWYDITQWEKDSNGDYVLDSSGNKVHPRANKTFTCTGEIAKDGKVPSSCFRLYWDGDYFDELFDGKYDSKDTFTSSPLIEKQKDDLSGSTKLMTFANWNAQSCNTTKATPCLSADILGDWREEVVLWDGNNSTDLLIFSTTIETNYRIPTLMEDHNYRLAIAWQNTAYNQPPHLGYNLEEYITAVAGVSISSGSMNQICYMSDDITPIDFVVKYATGAVCSELPEGLTFTFDASTLSGRISGAIAKEGEYPFTITTTGGAKDENASLSGVIKVRPNNTLLLAAHFPFEVVGATTPNHIKGEAKAYADKAGEAVDGKKGNALKLDGTNCYVQDGYEHIDFSDKAFTIELWFNSTDAAAYMLHKGAIASADGGNWIGLEYKNKALRFAVDDDKDATGGGKSEVILQNADGYFDGEWHHIVMVRNVFEKKLLLYLDGELAASADDKTGSVDCAGMPLVIGNCNISFNNFYEGLFDELSIYQGVMSAEKIKEHYECAAADYLAYFPMDDLSDTTPNLAYGEATASNPLGSGDGVKSGAVEFDGTGMLKQPVYDALQVGESDFSVSLWMRSTDNDAYLFCLGTHNKTNVEGGTGNWIGLERKNGFLCFAIDDDVTKTDCKEAAADDVFDGNWHHIVCVRDFAGKTTTLYVDGVERAKAADVKTGAIRFSATELLFIGGDDEANREFAGAIDELVIYPRALSPEEVTDEYSLLRLSDLDEVMAGGANTRYTVVDAFSGLIMRTAVGVDRADILDGMARGVYILVVEDGASVKTYKFVKRD